jgi:hypothetical protein
MCRPWLLLIAAACSEFAIIPPPNIDVVPHVYVPPSAEHVDAFTQVTAPKVDVLWVVDNSSSMEEEADKLTYNFPLFIDYFIDSGLDWHVGVVSTNMEMAGHKGQLLEASGFAWIDPLTPDPAAVFAQMVPCYPGVSHEESGRAAVYATLEELVDTVNQGFLRDDSTLHVIVISDEDDHSVAPDKGEFVAWYENLRSEPETRTFSAITGLELCPNVNELGTDYVDVTQAIGGSLWSICEADWAPVLDEIGLNASSLSTEFFLSRLPVPETINVTVTEPDQLPLTLSTDAWVYNESRNSIRFLAFVPSPLARVEIRFEVLR